MQLLQIGTIKSANDTHAKTGTRAHLYAHIPNGQLKYTLAVNYIYKIRTQKINLEKPVIISGHL